jgi:hypothetical protein
MAEQDPREYRGGFRDPEKEGGDEEGGVPREMIDEAKAREDTGDEQALKSVITGRAGDSTSGDVAVDRTGGDEADATSHGGTGADA